MDKFIKVSVIMITYNHEKFIQEAIQGVLSQKANFSIELIISNDKSLDNTHEKIVEAIDHYHGDIIIRYFNQDKNLGMIKNFVHTYQKCTGEYIAMCEGDDYWTDPHKLQKQVDFMDENLDYSICFHHASILSLDGSTRELGWKKNESCKITKYDLGRINIISTPTIMYRNLKLELPKWFKDVIVGDYPLHLLHAQKGKIYYMKENMCTYREGIGIWSSNSQLEIYKKVYKLVQFLIPKIENKELISGLKDQKKWLISEINPKIHRKKENILKKILKFIKK